MELLQCSAAEIWKMLIPPAHRLFEADIPENELIFHYRKRIYFVNHDGSVISMDKPDHLEWMDFGLFLEHLASSDDTYDFDDNGEFDYGCVLLRMGYIVPAKREREKNSYLIEIVNTLAPDLMVTRYELNQVSFSFALYHALLRCHELNRKSDWEYEHEVKSIHKIENCEAKNLQMHH